ncbi:hypothetical protein [Hugenholtzia roseola]|uniref:hypothetical protein n=1 Tax=Hugenholtzia roseola TaxID=1002 RepID=UPI0003F9BA5D|nr:hypothetical protein [Hugenholtzia roseola]
MQLKFLERNDIDKEKWDFCIQNSINPLPYALSWYLDAVTAGRWAAVVGLENERYVAVMPLPWERKYYIRYLKQPIFCQQLGLFSMQKIEEDLWLEFLKIVEKKFRYASRYHFHVGQEKVINTLKKKYDFQTFYTHHLDLQLSYEQLSKRYDADKRYHLRQAAKKYKAGLFQIGSNLKPEQLYALFEESVSSKIVGGIDKKAAIIFKKLYQVLEKIAVCLIFIPLIKMKLRQVFLFFLGRNGTFIFLMQAGRNIEPIKDDFGF